MKTLLDKSVRDGMLLSHKLMLLALVVLTVSLFLDWGGGYMKIDGEEMTHLGFIEPGTGWHYNPNMWFALPAVFALYLGDPDDAIPGFKWLGWFATPIALLFALSLHYGHGIGGNFGGGAILAMFPIALLHLIEVLLAMRKAAGSSPPAAPQS